MLDVFAHGTRINSASAASDSATRSSRAPRWPPRTWRASRRSSRAAAGRDTGAVASVVTEAGVDGVVAKPGSGSPNELLQVPGAGTGGGAAPAPAPGAKPARPGPAPPATKPATGSAGMSATEAAVLDLVNAERAKAGCTALVANATLVTVARAHSADMAARNFFSHTTPTRLSRSTHA
jgi:uncharacterized protein YkwD